MKTNAKTRPWRRTRYIRSAFVAVRLLSRDPLSIEDLAGLLGTTWSDAYRTMKAIEAVGVRLEKVRDPGDARRILWTVKDSSPLPG